MIKVFPISRVVGVKVRTPEAVREMLEDEVSEDLVRRTKLQISGDVVGEHKDGEFKGSEACRLKVYVFPMQTVRSSGKRGQIFG